MSFVRELKRRNVFRVAAAYAVVSWLLVQVAFTVLPIFDIPQWILRAFIVLLVIGFPIALVLAWIYELTPEGVRISTDVTLDAPVPAVSNRAADFVIIGLLAVALIFVALRQYDFDGITGTDDQRVSVAVLAFENMSDDPQHDYLSDGISEELITVIAGLSELRVSSRTSSFSFKGTNTDLPSIAEALDVDHILGGSVRLVGSRIRITVRLIDVASDSHLWANSYDREIGDIFAIQDDIALRVKEALAAEILGDEAAPSIARRTESIEAYKAYLRGLEAQRRGFPISNLYEAQRHYRRAIELDPQFAQAHARLGGTFIGLGNFRAIEPADAYEQAESSIRRALDIDADLAAGHATLGWVRLSYHWDWDGAEESFRRAITLAPSLFAGHQGLSFALSTQGRLDEALSAAESAYRLDPLSAYSIIALQEVFYKRHEYDAALEWTKRILEVNPNATDMAFAAMIRLHRGDPAEQVRLDVEQALRTSPEDPHVTLMTALVHAQLGDDAKAYELIETALAKRDLEYVSAGYVAAIYANLGRNDEAFEWFDRAYSEYDSWMFSLQYADIDAIRDDPRFEALLTKLNLPNDAYR